MDIDRSSSLDTAIISVLQAGAFLTNQSLHMASRDDSQDSRCYGDEFKEFGKRTLKIRAQTYDSCTGCELLRGHEVQVDNVRIPVFIGVSVRVFPCINF